MTWRRTRLKYLAAAPIVNGLGESAKLDDETWPRYIRTTDFAGPRTLRAETKATLPPGVAARADVRRGDILMTAAGSVGRTFLYDSDDPACYAGYLVRFRPRPDVDPRFIAYWTETPAFIDQIETGKVTSTIDNFSAGKYQNLSIAVPDLRTQGAIADFLDSETARIDALIGKKRRLAEVLQARWVSHVEQTTQAGPSARVKFVTSLITSGPRGWGNRVGEKGAPFIRSGNLSEIGLDIRGPLARVEAGANAEASRSQVRSGDVLVGVTGANTSWVGLAGVDQVGGYVSQHVALLRPYDIEPAWLAYCVLAPTARRQLLGEQYGGTKQQLGLGELAELRIHVPRVDEQRERLEELRNYSTNHRSLLTALADQTRLLAEHRQALITAAVTGELEVPGVMA